MNRQRHAAGSDAMKFWHWKIWQWRVWRWIERIAHSIGAMLAIVAIAWIVVFVSRPSEKSGNQPSFTGAEQQQKRLAIFLDGTWNSVDSNTNVWRMRALTATKSKDRKPQLVYYSVGVNGFMGGVFGQGLDDNMVCLAASSRAVANKSMRRVGGASWRTFPAA
jgi:Uncharacterized alpha/beta hydrolase domain (DUF2235)